MDFNSRLAEALPVNAMAVHRGNLMLKASTAAGGEIQNDLLGATEVEAINDM